MSCIFENGHDGTPCRSGCR
jgi:hypothetical protein